MAGEIDMQELDKIISGICADTNVDGLDYCKPTKLCKFCVEDKKDLLELITTALAKQDVEGRIDELERLKDAITAERTLTGWGVIENRIAELHRNQEGEKG